MQDLTEPILELVRLAATDLPPDVETALRKAYDDEEPGSAAQDALDSIMKNVELARQNSTPICQDTGTPIFYVYFPEGWSNRKLRAQIENAVARATHLTYLRPNAVDAVSGKNSGNNLGDHGCENVGAQYSLPNAALGAGRDLAGVRRVVLDAVHKAQGKGCAPGILGVAIGGDRGSSYYASKEVLFRKLDDENTDVEFAKLENRLTQEANQLGIGPMGFGGKTTVLGTKITAMHRLPASYFVSVSYMCWAYRRRRMIWENGEARFE